ARTGHGVLVFLGGEAGVGKTELVDRFTDAHRASARILEGACDGTATPRPLGPLFDLLPSLGHGRGPAGRGVSRQGLFERLLDELARPPAPAVMIIEDVHWA